MELIKSETVHGATLKLLKAGEEFLMISPITGNHSISGSKERALCHWYGFLANNKDVPKPFAVYRHPSGEKLFYYSCNSNRDWLIKSSKPILSKHDLSLSVNSTSLNCLEVRLSLKDLDAKKETEGFYRLPEQDFFN